MTVRDKIRDAYERVFIWFGQPPRVVLVGMNLKEALLQEASESIAFSVARMEESPSESVCSQYVGVQIRFVPWLDGVFATPPIKDWTP